MKPRTVPGSTTRPQRSERQVAKFFMFGGFLGAGKTTAMLQFARWLSLRNRWKVALITNDQAVGLVDTALVSSGQFPVAEIGGGCFCCKCHSLVEAMKQLTENVQPQALIGEAVGSCTDLVSTVLEPLRTIYSSAYKLAPLSVLVDPFRAECIVNARGVVAAGFSQDVNYIYRKQLEEAAIIVINKCDVFPERRLIVLREQLESQFPRAEVLPVSARSGAGLENWWERLLTHTHAVERLMDVDYRVYAEGEAQLGWVNGEYDVQFAAPLQPHGSGLTEIDGNKLIETVGGSIKESFEAEGLEVAHMKISLEPTAAPRKHKASNTPHPISKRKDNAMSVIQWVRTGSELEFTRRLERPLTHGRMLLNLRAEAEPDRLTEITVRALAMVSSHVSLRKRQYAAFKPAPPTPTHRVKELASPATVTI